MAGRLGVFALTGTVAPTPDSELGSLTLVR